MNEKTKCPLCGGRSKSGICSECGYIIPDSEELDYETRLASAEPEDYPRQEAMRNVLAEEKVNVKVRNDYMPDVLTPPPPPVQTVKKPAVNKQSSVNNVNNAAPMKKSVYVHRGERLSLIDRIDNMLYRNSKIFYGIYIALMLLLSGEEYMAAVLISLFLYMLIGIRCDFFSTKKTILLYLTAILAIIVKLGLEEMFRYGF